MRHIENANVCNKQSEGREIKESANTRLTDDRLGSLNRRDNTVTLKGGGCEGEIGVGCRSIEGVDVRCESETERRQ